MHVFPHSHIYLHLLFILQTHFHSYLHLHSKKLQHTPPDIEIGCQKFRYCNLGWSMTKGDLDMDGAEDLIIGSPFAATCGDQCGLVAVLLASERLVANAVMDAADLDLVLFGRMAYEWFGHSAVFRAGVLAVGAPESRLCADKSCQISEGDRQAQILI